MVRQDLTRVVVVSYQVVGAMSRVEASMASFHRLFQDRSKREDLLSQQV